MKNSSPIKKIKVAVDTRDLKISKTGTKTYLEEIITAFSKPSPDFKFHFIKAMLPVYSGKNLFLKSIEHIRFFFWKQIQLPFICLVHRCDILYCTDYFLPFLSFHFKTAVVFHDAFFWEYPEHYNPLWLKILNTFGVRAARKADAIITTTHYSKNQLIKYLGFNSNKIHVIYLAPKSSTRKVNATNLIIDPNKKYILHIGVLEIRKNLQNLIKAFHLLLQDGFEDYYLVLGGSNSVKTNLDDSPNIRSLINQLSLQERVIITGFIPDEELAGLYQYSSAYAFVSINEGFGIPMLEAFQNKVPVLIANNSCLPEVAGGAAIMCNPFDTIDIKNGLKTILQNNSLREELVRKGTERLAMFSWKMTAENTLSVFKKMMAVNDV